MQNQNNRKLKTRILSILLSMAMVTTMVPTTVFATEGDLSIDAGGMAECHAQHDESCGYKEAIHSHECSHIHDERCNESPLKCQHEHNEDCNYMEAIVGNPCTHSCESCQPKDSGKTEGEISLSDSAQAFVDCVMAIDRENLYTLITAYQDALKAYDADTSDSESTQLLADLKTAFTSAYEVVVGVDGKSAKERYELLSDQDRTIDAVRLAKETLDGIIAAVAELRPSANVVLLGTETAVTDFSGLQTAIKSASTDSANPTTIIIGGNFDLTAMLTLTGKHIKITSASGESFTLTRASSFNGIAFVIERNSSLTLENIIIDGNKTSVSSASELIAVRGTTLTMENGAALQNNKSSAITMSNSAAKVYINGGTISGNESTMDGGAISDGSSGGAIIEINGGEIKGNKATKAGGAINSKNAITIAGGTISSNTAGTTGGGISRTGGTLTMTGGVIQDNTAGTNGDNVYLKGTGSILNIGDSASIPAGLTLEQTPKIWISSPLQGSFGIAKILTNPAVGLLVAGAANTYTITAEDVKKFTYADDAFGFKLEGNQIKLATPAGVPEATTSNIYAKGLPLILVAGTSTPTNTVIYIDKNSNGTVEVDTDKLWAPNGKDTTVVGNDLSSYSIFGGDSTSAYNGDTSITMLGGTVNSIYGGSHAAPITGDTYVTIFGGTVRSEVFGGSYDGKVTGNTNVRMTSGTAKILNGGGSQQTAPISGNTQVTVSGGKAEEIFGCGAFGSVGGNVSIFLSDGTISESVYGGAQNYNTTVGGTVTITITGGTVTKNVYTDGYSTTTIAGTKSVTVGGNAKIGSIRSPYFYGVAINGGINQKGVDLFTIQPDLGNDAAINVNLFDRYPDLVGNPIIATDAVEEDLAKVKLVGASANGLQAYFDNSDNTIKLKYETAIGSVHVTPNQDIVPLGSQKQFSATVTGTGSPAQTVTWSVAGGVSGTSIGADGMLTVAADETADTLTVTATSTADTSKFGTVTVNIRKLTGIEVKTAPTKTVYTAGERFDNSAMVVVANYREGTGSLERVITNYTFSPNGALAVSDKLVTISFTDCGVTKTATQEITVNDVVNAAAPKLSTDLSTNEVSYSVGDSASPLDATATVTDGGTLSYEWYRNTTNSTLGGTKLSETNASYTPSTTSVGTTYYYCIVKNTISDNGDGGTKTATTTTSIAQIKVNEVFVPVTNITGVPTAATVGTDLTLIGTVAPENATNKTIVWSVNSDGDTGATIESGKLKTTAAGDVFVTATIINGLAVGSDYTQNFTITVTAVKTLVSIAVTTAPTKTAYTTGQIFDNTGMVVTATYSDNTTAVVSGYTFSPNTALATTNTTITISYTDNGTTVTTTQAITVTDVPTTHIITVSAGTGGSISPSGTVTVNNGESKTFTIAPNSNYSISSVSVDGVSQGAIRTYTFTNVTENHSISANFRYHGGSSSDDDDSSSDGEDSSSTTPTTKPTEPVIGSSNTTATVDKNGNATTTVSDKNISDAVKAAQDTANKKGVNLGEVTAVINVTVPTNSSPNTVTVNLPKTVQQQVISKKIDNLTIVIHKPDISIGMNLAMITEMNKQANADVQLSATRTDATKLSTEAINAMGNRPAFDLKATYNSGTKSITNFGSGFVSVAIPYTLQRGEVAGGLHAVYIDSNGRVDDITSSSYDTNAKMLRFATNHFSVYGIAYKAPMGFTDIADHWAKTDIEFAVNRRLMSGTSSTLFSPNLAMTRGMFVTALGRLAGVDENSYKNGKFTDVKADAYYASYVNWAAEKGITSGTTATTFSPDNTVTRQEMAVIIAGYAKAMGYKVPETRVAVTFADNSVIASWAAVAVKQMQMAGVLNGKNGNKFDPTSTATRAEVAALLHRYVELIIDRTTAQGLDVNDSGSAMMYENGKAVRSASRKVDSGTYHFNTYGEAALLPIEKKNYTLHTVKKNEYFYIIAKQYRCSMRELMELNGKKMGDVIYPGDVLKIPQK